MLLIDSFMNIFDDDLTVSNNKIYWKYNNDEDQYDNHQNVSVLKGKYQLC